MIHINLNMIVYPHVEHRPTKTIYIKYYTEKQKKFTIKLAALMLPLLTIATVEEKANTCTD